MEYLGRLRLIVISKGDREDDAKPAGVLGKDRLLRVLLGDPGLFCTPSGIVALPFRARSTGHLTTDGGGDDIPAVMRLAYVGERCDCLTCLAHRSALSGRAYAYRLFSVPVYVRDFCEIFFSDYLIPGTCLSEILGS